MRKILVTIAAASMSTAASAVTQIDAYACRTDELINSAFATGKTRIEKAIGTLPANTGKTFLVDFRIRTDGAFDQVTIKPPSIDDQKLVPGIAKVVSSFNLGPGNCADQFVKAYPIRVAGKVQF